MLLGDSYFLKRLDLLCLNKTFRCMEYMIRSIFILLNNFNTNFRFGVGKKGMEKLCLEELHHLNKEIQDNVGKPYDVSVILKIIPTQ